MRLRESVARENRTPRLSGGRWPALRRLGAPPPTRRKPVWHILEGEFELVLANPLHIRNVPGRKSDVNDATWIADLLAHGLIRSSMVPPGPIQELRDLTRTRKQLIRGVVQHKQRMKVLEDANVKL